jgi:hypothetical protein
MYKNELDCMNSLFYRPILHCEFEYEIFIELMWCHQNMAK